MIVESFILSRYRRFERKVHRERRSGDGFGQCICMKQVEEKREANLTIELDNDDHTRCMKLAGNKHYALPFFCSFMAAIRYRRSAYTSK